MRFSLVTVTTWTRFALVSSGSASPIARVAGRLKSHGHRCGVERERLFRLAWHHQHGTAGLEDQGLCRRLVGELVGLGGNNGQVSQSCIFDHQPRKLRSVASFEDSLLEHAAVFRRLLEGGEGRLGLFASLLGFGVWPAPVR